MRFTARILAALFAFALIFFITKVSFAQTTSLQQNPPPAYLNPNMDAGVPNNLHTWSQNVVLEVMSAVVCQLAGIDPISLNQQCLGINQQTGKIGYVKSDGGAISMVGGMIGGLYVVPVRFGDYIANVSDDFGIVKKAHAQFTGIGYNGLLPIQNLWKTFRNLAYLLFIIVFIVIGIAIMLRVNIDARTVMTIQNQIPRLIVGIILVTFSYAIAGFLIDLMWVGNYVVVTTISQGSTVNSSDVMTQATQGAPGFVNYVVAPANGNPFGGIISVTSGSAAGIGDLIQNLFSPNNVSPSVDTASPCGWDPFCAVGNFIGGSIQNLIGNIIGLIVSWIARILAFLIIAIAILWALVKLWFSLIKAYVFVLIDTVLAPFWIVTGIFPKAPPGFGFGSWLRDLIANLAVFPTILGLFMFARVILDNFGANQVATQFNPPLIGNPGGTNGIASLIALGIILMAPGIADSIKKAIKTTGVPTGFGGASFGAAAVGAAGGAIGRRLYRRDREGNLVESPLVNLQRRVVNRAYETKLIGGPVRWAQGSSVGKAVGKLFSPVSPSTDKTGSGSTSRDYSSDRGPTPGPKEEK